MCPENPSSRQSSSEGCCLVYYIVSMNNACSILYYYFYDISLSFHYGSKLYHMRMYFNTRLWNDIESLSSFVWQSNARQIMIFYKILVTNFRLGNELSDMITLLRCYFRRSSQHGEYWSWALEQILVHWCVVSWTRQPRV